MSEQSEQIPAAEVKKAKMMLTPEERVQSEARYEVMKHQNSLIKAGISEAQIQSAAVFASETALEEYKDLVAQNPWKTTTDILNRVIEGFEGDDKMIAETFRSAGSNFPTGWKYAIEWYRDLTKKTKPGQSFEETVRSLQWYNRCPTFTETDEKGNNYPSLVVMDSRYRYIFEKNLENDSRGRDLVVPSIEAVRSIFEAFGAELPTTIGKQIDKGELIETKLPGIFLSAKGEGGRIVSVNFSVDTLEKIVTLPHETK